MTELSRHPIPIPKSWPKKGKKGEGRSMKYMWFNSKKWPNRLTSIVESEQFWWIFVQCWFPFESGNTRKHLRIWKQLARNRKPFGHFIEMYHISRNGNGLFMAVAFEITPTVKLDVFHSEIPVCKYIPCALV